MSQLFVYADAESIAVLSAEHAKAILLGSDFGYGNFGDLLQHMGSIRRIKKCSTLRTASVLSLDAISRHVSVASLRRSYGVDALMFVSSAPLTSDQADVLGLKGVAELRNVSCVQLYGGGFLNETWGDFVLEAAEFFLRKLPGAAYFVSGQQVSSGYAGRVLQHVGEFNPRLFGVRDRDSLQMLQATGIDAEYSFDDAVEPLQELSKIIVLERGGSGLFMHLNSSGYTGNGRAIDELMAQLQVLAERTDRTDVILFQAFQDAREEVIDSIETVKRLEHGFPFVDLNTVMLVSSIMEGEREDGRVHKVVGQFGYACSYHITLWLQLNGIPCWLRGSNSYYDQKRRSLGIEGDLDSFLAALPVPDHSANLIERSLWTAKLETAIADIGVVANDAQLEPAGLVPTRTFQFKGEPRLEERLSEAWASVNGLQEERQRLHVEFEQQKGAGFEELLARINQGFEAIERREIAIIDRFEALSSTVVTVGDECGALAEQLRIAELGWTATRESSERLGTYLAAFSGREPLERQLQVSESRLQACGDQLTVVGAEARRYREQAERDHVAMLAATENAQRTSGVLDEIVRSRSWRWTRPLRVTNRFLLTGRFDARGQVGLFEALRRIAQRLPIPASWKSTMGRYLHRMRRR